MCEIWRKWRNQLFLFLLNTKWLDTFSTEISKMDIQLCYFVCRLDLSWNIHGSRMLRRPRMISISWNTTSLRSNSFIRETHSPSIPIFLLIFHHVLFFFFINYSSHVSLYFQKCKGKSGTYRSTTIFIEITSRFRITNCLLIDRLINSCKMIIKR